MPRKSTGTAATGSAPTTPAKGSGGGNPRKSLVSEAGENSERGETSTATGSGAGSSSASGGLVMPVATKAVLAQQTSALKGLSVGIDQFELPKASVMKVAKSELSDQVQLRKEVVTALVKSSTVFISYLTATAHDIASNKGLKTITGQNVLDAITDAGFDQELRKELKLELETFRNVAKEKREKSKMAKSASSTNLAEANDNADDADVSRFTNNAEDDEGLEEEEEEEALDEEEQEDQDDNDASLLRNSLNKKSGRKSNQSQNQDDEDDEVEAEDQLMDED